MTYDKEDLIITKSWIENNHIYMDVQGRGEPIRVNIDDLTKKNGIMAEQEYDAHQQEIADAREEGYQQGYRQALDDNYNTLANELKWVIDKFGSDAYMDIRTSVCIAQDKLTK